MKNKILIIFAILVTLFTTTSCINYAELNEIGIINSMGINKKNDKYIINVNMLTPNENSINKSIKYETSGSSITDAFNNLYLTTSKKVNLSHIELLILSKNLEKEDYINIKDFFLSQKNSRNNFNIIILENYSESNIFKYNTIDINNLIVTNSKEMGIVFPKTFDEVIQDILNINKSYIPTIKIEKEIKILGYRIVFNDEKLLSVEESNTFNFLLNKINKCNFTYKNTNIKVESNITRIDINNNIININIFSTISGETKEYLNGIYINILKDHINKFINNNDLEYFYNLVKKYNKNNKYTKNNLVFNININPKTNKVINYE